MALYTVLLALMGLVAVSHAYSTGARSTSDIQKMFQSCQVGHVTPGHGKRQRGTPPFTITLSPTVYRPNQDITVTVTSAPGKTFKGFFFYVAGDATDPFFRPSYSFVGNQIQNGTFCGLHGVTHTSPVPKTSITFKWTPAQGHIGDVWVGGSIVVDRMAYWRDLESNLISPAPGQETLKVVAEREAKAKFEEMQRNFASGRGMNFGAMFGAMGGQQQQQQQQQPGGGAGGLQNLMKNMMANMQRANGGAGVAATGGAPSNPFAALMPPMPGMNPMGPGGAAPPQMPAFPNFGAFSTQG